MYPVIFVEFTKTVKIAFRVDFISVFNAFKSNSPVQYSCVLVKSEKKFDGSPNACYALSADG